MKSRRQQRCIAPRGGRRALIMLLAILIALAPMLAPAQSRHAGATAGDAVVDMSQPPCHAHTLGQDKPPACPHCVDEHLSGCPCCEHAAPSGLPSIENDNTPARFSTTYLRQHSDGLPPAPAEACFRPPISRLS